MLYENFYQPFKHWNSRGSIWFYSDPHFNDDEMKYLRKNYIGDDEQVKRINSKVGKYDTLVILGDVGDIEYVKKLRGYKVLVMGNHDKGASNYRKKTLTTMYYSDNLTSAEVKAEVRNKIGCDGWNITIKRTKFDDGTSGWMVNADNGLFDEVYEGPLFIAPQILLSHEPINFPFARNIHGHTHGEWNAYNMCAEMIDYTPVPLSYFLKMGITNIPDIHRATIDNAIERKANKVRKDNKLQEE